MTKKIPPITAQAPRRSRRSPEELLSELEKKKQADAEAKIKAVEAQLTAL